MPFQKKSFDTVVFCDVLEHLPDFEGALRTGSELARDHVLISLPLGGFHRQLARIIGIDVEKYDREIGHLHVYNYGEAKNTIEQCLGGELIYEEGLYVTPKLLAGWFQHIPWLKN